MLMLASYRYVAELRSLVEHYSHPLLHPHLLSSSPIPQCSLSVSPQPSSSTRTLSPYPSSSSPPPTTSTSSAELPIASRFSRSPSPLPSPPSPPPSSSGPPRDLSALDFSPDSSYSSEEYHQQQHSSRPPTRSYLGRPSLPDLPTGARRTSVLTPPPPPLVPLSSTASTGRLASLGSRARDSFRPASSSSSRRKLQQAGEEGSEELARPVPPLPEALRKVLGATIDMLQGHEDLSARL